VEFAVIGAAPGRIAEDFVSTVQSLNLETRFIGAGVGVRMKTLGQLPIGITDLGASAPAVETEGLVVSRFRGADR
jgi:hypothetical protein